MKNEAVTLLIEDIQNKVGKKLNYERDFVELSKDIFDKTNAQISVSTLKRFFGKVNSPFQPSKFTLDTMVAYLGFEDWNTYIKDFAEPKNPNLTGDAWNALKKRFQLVTEHGLATLKQKTGYNHETFLPREFVREKLNGFQESSKTATMLIAPDGYGKSSLLIQIVENYLWGAQEDYKNDIVCLIDGGTFFNLFSQDTRDELLNQILEFKLESSLYSFFKNNPQQIKGRLWLLIDDVDEVFTNKTRYHYFVENLKQIIQVHCNNNWVKIIFTCRPENLDVFSGFIKKNPTLADCWYKVNFSSGSMAESINVPLLSEEEIGKVLMNADYRHSFKYLKDNHSEVLEIIQQPNLLALFIEEYHRNQHVSDYYLLSSYVTRELFKQPYRDEKMLIIDRFLELCDMARESTSVKKELLPDKGLGIGYRELLSIGMIYEYTVPVEVFDQQIYVKFSRNAVFEFMLINKWVRNKPLNIELLRQIGEFYKDNEQLRCRLLQLSAKILLHQKAFDAIIKLHNEFEKYVLPSIATSLEIPLPSCLESLSDMIKKWLRVNDEFGKHFLPWVKSSPVGRALYASEVD